VTGTAGGLPVAAAQAAATGNHFTIHHFTIGKSILQSNMDEEAARLLSFLHDKKGSISNWFMYKV
jgi:hypothetical protein